MGAAAMMRLTANDSNEPKPHIDERKSGKQEPNGQKKCATEKERLGLVKAASDAGALGDAGEAMKACDAIVVRSGWGWCVFPAIGTGLVKQQDQRFLLLAG
jgi:hypothetical protein